MSDPTCALIIRYLNEARHLPRLLDGVARQTCRTVELIGVDSGSTDGSSELIRQAGGRVVRIGRDEFSFGRALNLGAAATDAEVLVLASAHIYPATDRWLDRLLEPFGRPGVALVYGGQRGDARTKFSERQILRQWFPEASCEDQRHPFCNNGNAAIRRARWRELPYHEGLPGLEDIWWAKAMLERGYAITYRHDAEVVHVHEESYGKIYQRHRREAMALQTISPSERMPAWDAVGLMRRAIASDLQQAGREGVVGEVWWSVLRFRAAQYWGAYRGLRWRGRLTSDLRARLYYPRSHDERAHEAPPMIDTPSVLVESQNR